MLCMKTNTSKAVLIKSFSSVYCPYPATEFDKINSFALLLAEHNLIFTAIDERMPYGHADPEFSFEVSLVTIHPCLG